MAELLHFLQTPSAEPAAVRVVEVAEAQWGVVSRRQIEAAGASRATLARWLRDGLVHRLHRAVYALGHRRLPIEGRLFAALLYAGEGAALSHTTAAWWWGLTATEPTRIHVSAACGRRSSTSAIRVHRPRALEAVTHRGMPVTPVTRTLLDLAAAVSKRELRRALAEAEFRGLLDLDTVTTTLGRGHPGSAALREALMRHRPELAETCSALEERFIELCEAHGVPLPEINVRIGPFTVDALWRVSELVVELDGGAGHATPARMEADRRRDLFLRGLGYRIQRYTWSQVTREAAAVAEDVRAALTG